MNGSRLHLVPVRSREAKEFVRTWHRHHPPPAGQIFAVAAADGEGTLRAVAVVGRPVACHLDDGTTLEVTRTASDGARNANSLRGRGWRTIASRPPRRGWHAPSRPRAGYGNDRTARHLWEAP
ncbi:XF1762 family protein [Streptomyces sp. NPDC096057]|uniref:XF1762 family protein n=1 Tax=Streptomyces sp. NPDC096057 TaxID=3155543 RepID=UPI0033247763